MDERFVIIGAGTMGVGIGYVAASSGYRVELVEVDAARAESALLTMSDLWERAVARGRLDAATAADARGRVSVVGTVSALAPEPAVVVEAVPEKLDLKQSVLRAAEAHRPHLLASNTSSIPIGALADGLEHPDRLIGLHFFNPVWAMPLLEIVVGAASAQSTVDAARAVAATLGKDPILVRDMPGFATSRLGVALGLEAIRMVADGVATPADIDKAMVLGYRHPMGPLELTDVVGLDVRLDIARTLEKAYGDRFAPPPLLIEMVAQGRLGKKSGEGFYQW